MPNWCSNTVTFTHSDPTMIQSVVDRFNKGGFFNSFVPLNESDDNQIESAIAKWGCKWDLDAKNYDFGESAPNRADPNTVTLCFETPWSPPVVFYQSMMEDYGYGVEAKYFEPGMGFAGYWTNGDIEEYEFGNAHDVAELPEDLVEEFQIDGYFEEEENVE